MHEASAVTRAITGWFDHLAGTAPPTRVRVTIRDPSRAHPDAVRLYAEESLRALGVGHPNVTIEVSPVPCAACGEPGYPSPMDPVCAHCGMPYRPVEGPAIVVGEA